MRLGSMMVCFAAMLCGVSGGARSEDLMAARTCAEIADKAARLSCYDAAFAATSVPAVGAAPSPGAAPPALPAPSAQFGDLGQLHPPVTSLPKKLTAKVQRVSDLGQGLYRLTLDDGQVWQTREADWALEFKSSDVVTISRMVFNTYQISLASQPGRSVGVTRIR